MRSFLIENDDIIINNSTIEMIEDDYEICQCVERTLTTRLEEFFLDLEHGMDYTEFESKMPDIERLKIDITEAVLQEERVQFVEKIDIEIDNTTRSAVVRFLFKLIDNTEFEGEVKI